MILWHSTSSWYCELLILAGVWSPGAEKPFLEREIHKWWDSNGSKKKAIIHIRNINHTVEMRRCEEMSESSNGLTPWNYRTRVMNSLLTWRWSFSLTFSFRHGRRSQTLIFFSNRSRYVVSTGYFDVIKLPVFCYRKVCRFRAIGLLQGAYLESVVLALYYIPPSVKNNDFVDSDHTYSIWYLYRHERLKDCSARWIVKNSNCPIIHLSDISQWYRNVLFKRGLCGDDLKIIKGESANSQHKNSYTDLALKFVKEFLLRFPKICK